MKRAFVWTLPAALLFLGVPVCAKVVYVNGDHSQAPHDGASWATACPTVTAGLNAAASGDEVWVAGTEYFEAIAPPAGVKLYGGFAGWETQRSQRDWKSYPTILDGGGASGAVVTCSAANVVFDGFTVTDSGTGVNVTGGTATLANNRISSNKYFGVSVAVSGAVTLTGNTVSGSNNGVYVSGTATLSNNTVAGNGFGVEAFFGTVSLTNNIVAYNSYGVVNSSGSVSSFSHNDVYGNTLVNYSGYTPPSNQGNLVLDPQFTDRTNGDYRLADGSPCIDAGDDSAVTAGETELSGRPRILGAHVDIGAYEYGARIFHVSKAGGNSGGLTWATAKRTVGAALALARESDEVWVAGGKYEENVAPPEGVGLYGGFAGTETARSQRRLNTSTTTLDGSERVGEVVTCLYAGLVVDGFTVTNGTSGVYMSGGTVTLANNTISGNTEEGVDTYGTATLIGNTISNNGAGSSGGVGVNVSGGTATLVNNMVSGNASDGVTVDGTATLTGNMVTGNGVGPSGGNGVSVSGSATLTNNTVSGNSLSGVYAFDDATATVNNNTISGNKNYGVYADIVQSAAVTLTNNTVSGNTDDGMYLKGAVTVTGNTISGNKKNGVSVNSSGNDDSATLTSNTISGNTNDGVFVADGGKAALTNNIVTFSGLYGVHRSSIVSTISTFSHNDVYGNTGANYSGYAPPSSQGNLVLDPLFVNRANGDFHLQSGSPCIDAGDDSVVTAGETDKDGRSRIQGAHVDIGAYEYVAPYAVADVKGALEIAGGKTAATAADAAHMNVEGGGTVVNLLDAVRLARKAAGVDANP